MSDLPHESGPDLHAILGLDDVAGKGAEPRISLDGLLEEPPAQQPAVPPVPPANGAQAHIEQPAVAPVEEDGESAEAQRAWTGITRPSRRGS
ncbi:MAG TPA: hypothetical protein VNZ05_06585, partial [Solirubrobacteraceae bacterium]|nr:hypothetical protein [Solirubrobacteraceae bacterium]